jgi:hypothetical protein
VPPRDLRHNRAGRQGLFDDPHLIVARPATTTLNLAQNLYPHLPTLRLALKLDPRRIPITQQGGPPRRNTVVFEHAAKLNWEGIVSKRADAAYRSERTEAWLKIKTVQREKFPVIGFVKDPTGVAALYLGKREGKELVYMGKVGTGWSRTISSHIRKQLDTVVSPKSKLTKPVKKPKATWVEPKFTADVEYRDITSEGLLRQSSFKGLNRT